MKLLLINRCQLGYHTDTYYYCKYLRNDFDITYICWDYGYNKVSLKNIRVIYISRNGPKVKRYLRFIYSVLKESKISSYNLVFIENFRGCSLLKLFYPKKKYILDIRSGLISHKYFNRLIYNLLLKFELLFFENVTIISKSLADYLKINQDKIHVLPLGSDSISQTNKSFDEFNLLYVGTLSNRNIEQTILGFDKFYHEFRNKINLMYTIIGFGYNNEENKLLATIKEKKLENVVQLLSRIPHNQLQHYFETHNIGVSYIPITNYFNCQPSTKTFEYILSGMVIVATATKENKKVVNDYNGVLIEDSSNSFYEGLKKIYDYKKKYDSEEIRETCKAYTWKNIVLNNLKNYLTSLV